MIKSIKKVFELLNKNDKNNNGNKLKYLIILAYVVFILSLIVLFIPLFQKIHQSESSNTPRITRSVKTHQHQKPQTNAKKLATTGNYEDNSNYNYNGQGYKYLFIKHIPDGETANNSELPKEKFNRIYSQMLINSANGLWQENINLINPYLQAYKFTKSDNKMLFGMYLDSLLLSHFNKSMDKADMGRIIREDIKTPQILALCTMHANPIFLTTFVIDQKYSIAPNSVVRYPLPKFKQYVSREQASTLPKLDIPFNPLNVIYERYHTVKSVYEISVPARQELKNNNRKFSTKLYTYIIEYKDGKLAYYGMYYADNAGDVNSETDEKPISYYLTGAVKQAVENATNHQKNDKSNMAQDPSWGDFYKK